jgi:hypothetical protein
VVQTLRGLSLGYRLTVGLEAGDLCCNRLNRSELSYLDGTRTLDGLHATV